MRIAIDVDGPMYEWDRTARYMLRTYRDSKGLEGPSLSWDHIMHHVSKDDWDWLWTEGVELGLFRYGHVVKDAVVTIRSIAEAHDLVAVTHRPKQAVKDTIAWFHYVNLPFSGYHILSDESPKSEIAADLLIDDRPENITDFLNAGRDAILFDRPWNQAYDASFSTSRYIRARGWREVENAVEAISFLRS